MSRFREAPALMLLVLVVVWLSATHHEFRNYENLSLVGQEAGALGIMACGEAIVILTGGIDLAVGATLAIAACAAGASTAGGLPWFLGALLGLAVGTLGGWANGALITLRKLPPILATLATMMLFRAAANVATGAAPYNQLPASFKAMGSGFTPFAVFIVVTAVIALMLTRSRTGRHVVAVGGAEQSARLSGVNVGRVLRFAYLVSGACAGLAGLLMSAGANNAQWNLGDGYEMDVIAAVVIGGVRLTGGQGSVVGAAIGAALIVVLRNALFLSGVPNEQYGLVTGAVVLLAALFEQARRTRSTGPAAQRAA